MAPGAQCSPADRQAQRYSSATDHPVAETVRISQSHYGSRAGWRDWIFSTRFTSLDRRRAVPDFVRRSESGVDGPAGTKSARRTLHLAHVLEPARLLSNQ